LAELSSHDDRVPKEWTVKDQRMGYCKDGDAEEQRWEIADGARAEPGSPVQI